MQTRTTKPFDLTRVSTVEDEGEGERIRKEVAYGVHLTLNEHKRKKKRFATVTDGTHVLPC